MLTGSFTYESAAQIYVNSIDNQCMVGFKDKFFGDKETAWKIRFQFSPDAGITGQFIIASDKALNWRERNNKVSVTFSGAPVKSLNFNASSSDGIGFGFEVSSGIIKPSSIDYMNTPLNTIEMEAVKLLTTESIRSIAINERLIPGPYPTTANFLEIFKAGVGKFPSSSWYYPLNSYLKGHLANNQSLAPPSSSHKDIPFSVIFGSFYGFNPDRGQKATYKRIQDNAKSKYGLDIRINNDELRLTYPNHDGDTFLGYPVKEIAVYLPARQGMNRGVVSGRIYCGAESESTIENTFTKAFKANSWTCLGSRNWNTGRATYFHKGLWFASIRISNNYIIFDSRLLSSRSALNNAINSYCK